MSLVSPVSPTAVTAVARRIRRIAPSQWALFLFAVWLPGCRRLRHGCGQRASAFADGFWLIVYSGTGVLTALGLVAAVIAVRYRPSAKPRQEIACMFASWGSLLTLAFPLAYGFRHTLFYRDVTDAQGTAFKVALGLWAAGYAGLFLWSFVVWLGRVIRNATDQPDDPSA